MSKLGVIFKKHSSWLHFHKLFYIIFAFDWIINCCKSSAIVEKCVSSSVFNNLVTPANRFVMEIVYVWCVYSSQNSIICEPFYKLTVNIAKRIVMLLHRPNTWHSSSRLLLFVFFFATALYEALNSKFLALDIISKLRKKSIKTTSSALSPYFAIASHFSYIVLEQRLKSECGIDWKKVAKIVKTKLELLNFESSNHLMGCFSFRFSWKLDLV